MYNGKKNLNEMKTHLVKEMETRNFFPFLPPHPKQW